ncbi:hypothetical protein ASD38_01795 [Caulobacter sp. Root487D2Y]|nr:hypothetical protein ASD38_01795 [Caulobacter sp. Root487D2Y]
MRLLGNGSFIRFKLHQRALEETMGHVVRGDAYRGRHDGRQGRLGWLLFISAVNLMLWSCVIALIARAS